MLFISPWKLFSFSRYWNVCLDVLFMMKNGLIRFTINDITAWKTNNCNILQKQLPNIPRAIPDRKCFKKYLLIVQAMEQETNLRGSYDILIKNMSKKKGSLQVKWTELPGLIQMCLLICFSSMNWITLAMCYCWQWNQGESKQIKYNINLYSIIIAFFKHTILSHLHIFDSRISNKTFVFSQICKVRHSVIKFWIE